MHHSFSCFERINGHASKLTYVAASGRTEKIMKKFFKFITIAILFLISLSLFGRAVGLIGKGQNSQMAKLL
jgi:hypothetical protein